MRTIQATLFDLDGTLIDSEILWVEAIEAALRARGVPVTRAEMTTLVYGHSWADIYVEITRRYPGLYADRREIEAFTVPLFERLSRQRDIRIAPSIELLRRLAGCMPVGIVSGSTRERIEASVRELKIAELVKVLVGCEDVAAGKPDPAGFLLAARRLAVAPEACLAIEDSAAGVRAAKTAGMACVALLRPNAVEQKLDAADHVLASLADFAPGALGYRVPGWEAR